MVPLHVFYANSCTQAFPSSLSPLSSLPCLVSLPKGQGPCSINNGLSENSLREHQILPDSTVNRRYDLHILDLRKPNGNEILGQQDPANRRPMVPPVPFLQGMMVSKKPATAGSEHQLGLVAVLAMGLVSLITSFDSLLSLLTGCE